MRVPKDDPPLIRVAGREYVWKEGEGVLSDDSLPHEVINLSREPRVVLIVDLPRPLPLVPRLENKFVLWELAAPAYANKVIGKADTYTGDLV